MPSSKFPLSKNSVTDVSQKPTEEKEMTVPTMSGVEPLQA